MQRHRLKGGRHPPVPGAPHLFLGLFCPLANDSSTPGVKISITIGSGVSTGLESRGRPANQPGPPSGPGTCDLRHTTWPATQRATALSCPFTPPVGGPSLPVYASACASPMAGRVPRGPPAQDPASTLARSATAWRRSGRSAAHPPRRGGQCIGAGVPLATRDRRPCTVCLWWDEGDKKRGGVRRSPPPFPPHRVTPHGDDTSARVPLARLQGQHVRWSVCDRSAEVGVGGDGDPVCMNSRGWLGGFVEGVGSRAPSVGEGGL